MVRIGSLILSFRTHRRCEPESSTAEDSQNLHRYRRTGSPGRGFAAPEDDRVRARKSVVQNDENQGIVRLV
jgi:hypothetical protein